MNKIEFLVGGTIMRGHDAAILLPEEDPREALVEAIVQNVSTSVEVTVGGLTMHLAAWMDPDHWSEDWDAIGVDDVDALVAASVVGE